MNTKTKPAKTRNTGSGVRNPSNPTPKGTKARKGQGNGTKWGTPARVNGRNPFSCQPQPHIVCEKEYIDIPFAHRQHRHAGHCALIHGHNWSFKFTFGADKLDANGFVVDFGDLKWLKKWLTDLFDHALVLNEDDPYLAKLKVDLAPSFARIVTVPNCGAEGLAAYILKEVNQMMFRGLVGGGQHRGLRVLGVEVYEDSKNSAAAFFPL